MGDWRSVFCLGMALNALSEEHWTRFLKRRLRLEKESRISPRLVVHFPSQPSRGTLITGRVARVLKIDEAPRALGLAT